MVYSRRVPLIPSFESERPVPCGPVMTPFRRRGARLLMMSLPILFALASFGPSDLLSGVPHTQSHPSSSLPDAVRQNLVLNLDLTKGWTRLSHPGMKITIPPAEGPPGRRGGDLEAAAAAAAGGDGPECPIAGPSCPFYHSPPCHDFNRTAPKHPPPPPPPQPPPPAVEAPFFEKVSGRGGGETVLGAVREDSGGVGVVQRRRRRQRQQQREDATLPGAAAAESAAAPSPPSSLESQLCSIEAVVEPYINVLRAHSRAIEDDLKRNDDFREQAGAAVQSLRRDLKAIRQELMDLDQQRQAAAGRAEYGTAATLRSRMDKLAVQANSLEATIRRAQDQLDAMVEVENAVRQKEAGQLLWLGSELRSVRQAAERTIARLQEEMNKLQTRLDKTTEARVAISQVMSTVVQSTEVRRELRALADAALEAESQAAADLEAVRAANRGVLTDATALMVNLTSAGSLARAASLELALLQGQLELALQMQDYDYASRLSTAISDLQGAQQRSAESVVTMEKLMAAHDAVVRQRLADYTHHLTGLERASALVRNVRDLRDMYDSTKINEREALALAAKLAAALEELQVSEPPRLMRSMEAEAVVREVLA